MKVRVRGIEGVCDAKLIEDSQAPAIEFKQASGELVYADQPSAKQRIIVVWATEDELKRLTDLGFI